MNEWGQHCYVSGINDALLSITDALEKKSKKCLESKEMILAMSYLQDIVKDTLVRDRIQKLNSKYQKRLIAGTELSNGYTLKTNLWADFTIADRFGISRVENTFKRAFDERREYAEYVTELAMVLSWKVTEWGEYDNKELKNLYDKLFQEVDEWCQENMQADDLANYLNVIN